MTTTEFYDWAKDYAAKLRKELRKAAKDGTLPAGSTVRVRKETASLMTAVEANVDTPEHAVYFDMEEYCGLTRPDGSLQVCSTRSPNPTRISTTAGTAS